MVSSERIQFGEFDFNLQTGELHRQGVPVKLSPKPARLLTLLLRFPGQMVTRESIKTALWDPDTFVDFEHALNFCVRELRVALNDNSKTPRYLETLPRRGYRFLAEAEAYPVESPKPINDQANQIQAHAHYALARKALTQVGKEALEQAVSGFKQAIALEPDYAMAHSGLGAAHGLRSLNRRDPEDLDAAQRHLELALKLDQELAEPYPWLCYVHMRKNELEQAVLAGRRGTQLQPDLVHAHYFLGLAHFAAAESNFAQLQDAVTHLLDAARVGPQWLATWFVLSYAAMLAGDYEHAEEYAKKLLEGTTAVRGLPFIGAEIVLGTVNLHRGDPVIARSQLTDFLYRMSHSDHMYRDAMSASAACALGDVELRHGRNADALAAFRRAWHTVQENPRIMAYQRVAARAQSGLAAAYASCGEKERAADLLERAIDGARASELPEHNAAAATISELYWSIAAACMRIGNEENALLMLERSITLGWGDAWWLESDPEYASMRELPKFRSLVTLVRSRPRLNFRNPI